ncbi:hypothetical protein YC2023_092357 [Brassica napus]
MQIWVRRITTSSHLSEEVASALRHLPSSQSTNLMIHLFITGRVVHDPVMILKIGDLNSLSSNDLSRTTEISNSLCIQLCLRAQTKARQWATQTVARGSKQCPSHTLLSLFPAI